MSSSPQRLVPRKDGPASELRPAAEALARGECVLVPTETLYTAVVPLAQRSSLEPLARASGNALARFALSRDELAGASAPIQRLCERYWPGPLILALGENWRSPADPNARRVLELSGAPCVGVELARTVEESLSKFQFEPACIVDAGATRLGEPSAVLEFAAGRMRLLRPGLLDIESLRATAGLRIGFVCTGNTCRSPMAEGIARARLAAKLGTQPERLDELGFSVQSMGVYAGPGDPASRFAVETLAAQGIDIAAHRAQVALPELVAKLDRVYALTRSHLEALRMSLPPGKDRHCALLDPKGRDIADPIGGPRSAYEATAAQIAAAIDARLSEWA
jgi:protein-tyrosine-phosphatase/tRNA A37 threonylcarbamoyladenosine synthetase subunit TsaC/SUA5/YrdC